MLRISRIARGPATSNIFAAPHSGRWFNPPTMWAMSDVVAVFIGPFSFPFLFCYTFYLQVSEGNFSHYQDKNYFHAMPYTKEFMSEYQRLERWRWY